MKRPKSIVYIILLQNLYELFHVIKFYEASNFIKIFK